MEPFQGPFFRISTINIQLYLHADCLLVLVIDSICLYWRKAVIFFGLWQDALSSWIMTSSLTNQIFYWWNKKIIQIINVHICTDCWSNDCNLPLSFKWHTTLYHEWLEKFTCFLQAVNLDRFYQISSKYKKTNWRSLKRANSIIFPSDSIYLVLILLFNGISTFVGYLMPKQSL